MIQVKSSLKLSSEHSPTIITLSPTHNLVTIRSRENWLKYKKYLSTHYTKNTLLKTPEDVDVSL